MMANRIYKRSLVKEVLFCGIPTDRMQVQTTMRNEMKGELMLDCLQLCFALFLSYMSENK